MYGTSAQISQASVNTVAAKAWQAGSKMVVPVSRTSYLYSHFKHVRGTPAPEGSSGVSLTKIKILNTLIDRLAQIKQKPEAAAWRSDQLSDEQIDAMIEQYAGQIEQARKASIAMPYKSAPMTTPGQLLNLVA